MLLNQKIYLGKKVENLKSILKIHWCKYCIMVNSGSSANLLMVASLFFMKINSKEGMK